MSMKVSIVGGKRLNRAIARRVVNWCAEKFDLAEEALDLQIHVNIRKLNIDSGYCEEEYLYKVQNGISTARYILTIADNQTIRDFVMTVVHELIHVRQYIEGVWVGDGESEAWGLQEQFTDQIWRENII